MTEATEERCTRWLADPLHNRRCGRPAKADGLCGRHLAVARRREEADARWKADYARRLVENADAKVVADRLSALFGVRFDPYRHETKSPIAFQVILEDAIVLLARWEQKS